jgi:hypothetical protein
MGQHLFGLIEYSRVLTLTSKENGQGSPCKDVRFGSGFSRGPSELVLGRLTPSLSRVAGWSPRNLAFSSFYDLSMR